MTSPTGVATWPEELDTVRARQDRAALLAELTEVMMHPVHR